MGGAQGGADMRERLEITLAIVFGTIGLVLIIWALYRHRIPPFLRTILKAGVIGAIVSTFLWAFLAWSIPIGWLFFALYGVIIGAIIGFIIALTNYKLAS